MSDTHHSNMEFHSQVRNVLNAGMITIEAASPPVPWELCFIPYDWTDRTETLIKLTELLDCDEPRPILINGPSGSGKTALVGVVAARLKQRYPDGVLHLEPGQNSAEEELKSGLERLGEMRPGLSPIGAPKIYRSALAPRRMIVVVDEPRDRDEIERFWPKAPGVAYIILSSKFLRWRQAHSIELPPLDTEHAIALLASSEGLEPDVSARLVEAFGGLPGVLLNAGGIVASKVVSIEELVELAPDSGEIDYFLQAFESLSSEAQRVYSALSRLPDPVVHESLLEMYDSADESEGPFSELVDRRLIIKVAAKQWRLRIRRRDVIPGDSDDC